MVTVNEASLKRGNDEKEWLDFQQLAKHLFQYIEEMKLKLQEIEQCIRKSSVEKLKTCFHQVSVSLLELFCRLLFFFSFKNSTLYYFEFETA